jgi:ATP-dependent helicase HepA
MTTFVPGQRFISEAEPELGLGQVLEVNGRTVVLEFSAAATTRHYASANAPLTRLRFARGDAVQDRAGTRCVVLAVNETAGLLHYEVQVNQSLIRTLPETELSPLLSLSQPLKRLEALQVENPAWFCLRRAALDALGFIERSPLLGLCSGRTELLPHQLYIAHEVALRPAPRVLLSDEVGLGKTIEACLILQQQLFSGLAARVLVLVPESLVHQWLVELLRRFNLRFTILDQERCQALTAVNPDNPFESEQLVLCSRNLFREHPQWLDAALQCNWDLLIIDEAHHLLAQAADSAMDSTDYTVAKRLAAAVPGLLLLTATPDQAGLRSHFGLLQLLDPRRFHDFQAFADEQQRYIAVAELLAPLGNITTLTPAERAALVAQLQQFATDTQLQQLVAQLASVTRPETTDALASAVLAALLDRHGTGRVVFRNTRRTVSGFPERKLQTHPLTLPTLYAGLAAERNPEHNFLHDGTWLREDPRVGWLYDLLRDKRQLKFLLICQRRKTATVLEEFLRLHRGIRSAVFHEGLTLLERDRAAAWFAESDSGAQLLVCSEIGSEGRNFQFSHQLVLFDLPLNPDLLEQRIGRLDRIGQQHVVNIHVPFFTGTAQEVLLRFFAESLGIFRAPNAVAAEVGARVAENLQAALSAPTDANKVAALLRQAAQLNTELLALHASGRDRLLELNSCRPSVAQQLLQEVLQLERHESPQAFLQQVFAGYGLDFEENSNRTWVVTPGDDMLVTSFPQIPDDGLTFTLDRTLALARDDLPFVNWLHPLVLQSLDMVLQDNFGKCCAGTLRDKRLPAGTLVMESLFRVTVSAPPRLQARRYFPVSTLRAVVDSQKRSLGSSLPAEFLDRKIAALDKQELRTLVQERRALLQLLVKLGQQVAEKELPTLIARHTLAMQNQLDSEIARMEALQAINPQVQDDEIDYLRRQRAGLTEVFATARLQLEGLRLLLVV